ncbi:N-acetyltransferase [Saccharopolyspora sp. HNM0983]|uniref:N-acetyltransferase n=1 Tax=Saccharopolyspora montiporae TaxID=2781240 RepID=A0A929FY13_9PSEU|nr:N-acetyltransferase [Saccharopolyspora sp. HNM0983]
MPPTEVVDAPEQHRFEVRTGDEVAGFTEYRLQRGAIAFIHTEIDPRFEGRGLGSTLVRGALDEARRRGLAVLPYCPFVRSFIDGHREYLDLVPEDKHTYFRL